MPACAQQVPGSAQRGSSAGARLIRLRGHPRRQPSLDSTLNRSGHRPPGTNCQRKEWCRRDSGRQPQYPQHFSGQVLLTAGGRSGRARPVTARAGEPAFHHAASGLAILVRGVGHVDHRGAASEGREGRTQSSLPERERPQAQELLWRMSGCTCCRPGWSQVPSLLRIASRWIRSDRLMFRRAMFDRTLHGMFTPASRRCAAPVPALERRSSIRREIRCPGAPDRGRAPRTGASPFVNG